MFNFKSIHALPHSLDSDQKNNMDEFRIENLISNLNLITSAEFKLPLSDIMSSILPFLKDLMILKLVNEFDTVPLHFFIALFLNKIINYHLCKNIIRKMEDNEIGNDELE